MIISPPFLPKAGLAAPTGTNPDPMMDAVDERECDHGVYPIAFDRRWHCGMHLQPNEKGEVYAIADGEVVAYRVCQHAVDSGASHIGFVLLKHTTETGEGRTLVFYSLYMHLLPLVEYEEHCADKRRLPEFLRMPTGPVSRGQVTPAVSGEGKKVRRKDVLGWRGQYEEMPHLHFEIFMLPDDFDAYFGSTQLGNSTPTSPNGTDWWGHAYFVIPAGSNFRRLPEKADARNKLHGIEFKPGHEGSNTLPLLVETYFSVGSKYTKVWSMAQDGIRTLLTPQPVEEKDYEYDLYKRATALYSSCPSDGYELLRFGRILSPSQTLAADACATWMQVNWAAGKAGYIDINDPSIQKFSDADFLSFMGWQKISEGSTPFDSDGMCDVAALKEILGDAAPHEVPAVQGETLEAHKSRALSGYVRGNAQVRQQLRGLICNAPSEWDSTNNEERYASLLDEGGFYHGNDKGYNDFMKYLKEVQFWDKTGLPAGQKLWFFHPLAFIRHFRKCWWLTKDELAATFPRFPFYTGSGSPRRTIEIDNDIYRVTLNIARQRVRRHVIALNNCLRKYIGSDSKRVALFLAQVLLETAQWRDLGGVRRLMHEWGFGKYLAANPATKYYGPFYGRGIMQLTWAGNFDAYGKYRVIPDNTAGSYIERLPGSHHRITGVSQHYTANPSDGGQLMLWSPRYDPDVVAESADHACDSGGFYWVSKYFNKKLNINRIVDEDFSASSVDFVNRLVNGGGNGYYERQAYSVFILHVVGDRVEVGFDGVELVTPPHPKKSVLVSLLRPE
ncbi:M23 family metallopeptidase [Burkholderia cenocepacia]|uniref:M23 family metallopeptidase n=1 Tax=Burkholderia cenocepacia TaxID=95486 RepID=UPI002B24B4C9|nr:M23 family metallopeptidase [Burkholderia cenocepacia]MEB2610037.1 M23 family metallopeptidase [Burkholderia cenocepacia]